MKIYWYQGGIMAEPKNQKEIDALMTLWSGIKEKSDPASEFRSSEGSSLPGGSLVHGLDGVAVNQ
jgi:hypothetical protein